MPKGITVYLSEEEAETISMALDSADFYTGDDTFWGFLDKLKSKMAGIPKRIWDEGSKETERYIAWLNYTKDFDWEKYQKRLDVIGRKRIYHRKEVPE